MHTVPPTVLVIEDHEDTARLLRLLLDREGYAVTLVTDGEEARQLTATSTPPDLILLDIRLPSLGGLALLRIIRTTAEWQWTPVIMLTADMREETMTEATNLGATEYVQKSFLEQRLMASIHKFLPAASSAPLPGRDGGTTSDSTGAW